MSYTPNEIWLENAKENFDEALDKRDFVKAQTIIDEVAESGFTKEAEVLFKQWNHVKSLDREKIEDVKEDGYLFTSQKEAHDKIWKQITGHD